MKDSVPEFMKHPLKRFRLARHDEVSFTLHSEDELPDGHLPLGIYDMHAKEIVTETNDQGEVTKFLPVELLRRRRSGSKMVFGHYVAKIPFTEETPPLLEEDVIPPLTDIHPHVGGREVAEVSLVIGVAIAAGSLILRRMHTHRG